MIWIIFLSRMDVSTHTLTPEQAYLAFGDWLHSVPLDGAIPYSVLYLHARYLRLGLNLFRGEPAISEFDWNFTANHKSSKHFTTCPGSALHKVSPLLQPAHG